MKSILKQASRATTPTRLKPLTPAGVATAGPDPPVMSRSRLTAIQSWPQFADSCDCDPETVAVRAEVCKRQLERFILARFGVCLKLWLRDVKCRIGAAALLEGYGTDIAAKMAHYGSASGFCRAFKEVFGMAPQLYVLKHRNEERRLGTIMSP
jgi:AraC-like DNA-binding protein